MPFALIIIGLLLIVSGARGTYPQLRDLLVKDFTGQHNFMQWIVAIGGVGCLGYIPAFEKFSRVFLGLIIVSIFLAEKGFFGKFQSALGAVSSNTATAKAGTSTATASAGTTSAGSNALGVVTDPVRQATATVQGVVGTVTGTVNAVKSTASGALGALDELKSLGSFFGG